PPVPHHVANGGTTLSIRTKIRQFVSISERFPIRSRPHTPADVHFGADHVLPENVQRFPIRGVTRFHVIVGRPAARVHRSHRIPLQLGTCGERRSAEHINRSALREFCPLISLENVPSEFQLPLVTRRAI